VQYGHGAEEFHDLRLHELLLVVVPLGALQEEASDVGTVLGLFSDVLDGARCRDKVEVELVDGWALIVFSGELLQDASGEASRVGVG